jgi:hypothetical protein
MFRKHLQQNAMFLVQILSQWYFLYHMYYVNCFGIETGSHGVWSKIKYMRSTRINWFIAISLSSNHVLFCEYCWYSERFSLYTRLYLSVRQIFCSRSVIYAVHIASCLMWNRLYCPLQRQRPAQHDTLHTRSLVITQIQTDVCTLAADRI